MEPSSVSPHRAKLLHPCGSPEHGPPIERKEPDSASICVATGTTDELNLVDWERSSRPTVRPVVFEQSEETRKASIAGRCDAFTTDASQLAGIRTALDHPDDHVVLPDIISPGIISKEPVGSKEPLGPVVRKGDPQWFDILRWTLFALIEAEELGVTRANLDQMLECRNPAVQRLFGKSGGQGRPSRAAAVPPTMAATIARHWVRAIARVSGVSCLWRDDGRAEAGGPMFQVDARRRGRRSGPEVGTRRGEVPCRLRHGRRR